MTTPINSAATPTPISQAMAQPVETPKARNEMDKDAFLKLLVTQLKYQDPSKPADSATFLAQTAQFTQVEKLEEMADATTALLASQLRIGASSLVGKTVTYPGPDGSDRTGVVAAATLTGSTPTLRVGDTDVPLSSITGVRSSAG